jgi:hypothetical protein
MKNIKSLQFKLCNPIVNIFDAINKNCIDIYVDNINYSNGIYYCYNNKYIASYSTKFKDLKIIENRLKYMNLDMKDNVIQISIKN